MDRDKELTRLECVDRKNRGRGVDQARVPADRKVGNRELTRLALQLRRKERRPSTVGAEEDHLNSAKFIWTFVANAQVGIDVRLTRIGVRLDVMFDDKRVRSPAQVRHIM